MHKLIVSILSLFFTSGCVQSANINKQTSQVTRESRIQALKDKNEEHHNNIRAKIHNENCGSYPNNYQSLVKNKLATILKDPNSTQYNFKEKPRKGYKVVGDLENEQAIFCYVGDVLINAKNGFGGHTGFKLWTYKIRDGVIIDIWNVAELFKGI